GAAGTVAEDAHPRRGDLRLGAGRFLDLGARRRPLGHGVILPLASIAHRPRKTLDTRTAASVASWYGQCDQSVLARASTVPRVPGRPSEQGEDVPEMPHHGSVVSRLRAESSLGRLGYLPRTEEVRVYSGRRPSAPEARRAAMRTGSYCRSVRRISSVCWPSAGAGLRFGAAPSVFTGVPTSRSTPNRGCLTPMIMSRAATC